MLEYVKNVTLLKLTICQLERAFLLRFFTSFFMRNKATLA